MICVADYVMLRRVMRPLWLKVVEGIVFHNSVRWTCDAMRSSSSSGYDTPVRRSLDEGRDGQSERPDQFTVSPIQFDIAEFLGSHDIDDFGEILY